MEDSVHLDTRPCLRPRPSLPGMQPQALPSPLGSEAAAAGLCAGQCILKVSGNNVMNDGAPEVLEHFQAFRNHREEALVSHLAAKVVRGAPLRGWGAGAEDYPPFSGKSLRPHAFLGWAGLSTWWD